jgi:hypothetical protein
MCNRPDGLVFSLLRNLAECLIFDLNQGLAWMLLYASRYVFLDTTKGMVILPRSDTRSEFEVYRVGHSFKSWAGYFFAWRAIGGSDCPASMSRTVAVHYCRFQRRGADKLANPGFGPIGVARDLHGALHTRRFPASHRPREITSPVAARVRR